MKTKTLIVISFLFLIGIKEVYSQAGGLNIMLGFPMGEFKEKVDRLGYGLSGHFLFLAPSVNRPFGIGLNLGYLNYGQESRRVPWGPTAPDASINVDRTNNLVNFHALFQIGFPSGIIRPYIEGLFGGSYLYTETSINGDRNGETITSSLNFDDFAWSYGGGGGMLIQLSSGEEEGSDAGALFLDLKVRYLFGSEAEYLKEGSVSVSGGKVTYLVSKSKTDLLTVHAGVVAYFNSIFN